jgi:bacillithiol system protein YtxJ
MGIFNSIFGAPEPESIERMNWVMLENEQQLKTIDEQSQSIPVLIFKHSTRCSISRFALKNFEASFDIPAGQLTLYFLDLLAFRTISTQVAQKYGVQHESPQVLLIKNGLCTYDASHESILVEALKKEL